MPSIKELLSTDQIIGAYQLAYRVEHPHEVGPGGKKVMGTLIDLRDKSPKPRVSKNGSRKYPASIREVGKSV